MSDKTNIVWTDATWNPVAGCSKVSAGCENCYAETAAASGRLQQFPQYREVIQCGVDVQTGWNGKTAFVESALTKPLHWKKPRKIFVCSMGDLFHSSVPFEWIDKVMAIIALCPQHTFQIMTKRPERMLEYWTRMDACKPGSDVDLQLWDQWRVKNIKEDHEQPEFPLSNVWLGTTVENQAAADERIPKLLQCPAPVRFLSVEPMLEGIDFAKVELGDCFCPKCQKYFNEPKEWLSQCCGALTSYIKAEDSVKCDECGDVFNDDEMDMVCPHCEYSEGGMWIAPYYSECVSENDKRYGAVIQELDWVICGGESGPGARPVHPDWVRDLRDQCVDAQVPFMFKQWGEWFPREQWEHNPELILPDDCDCKEGKELKILDGHTVMHRVGKKKAGRALDGVTWDEYPGAI